MASVSIARRIQGNTAPKIIHFVRHAEGHHNVAGEKDRRNYLLPQLMDATLSDLGIQQCMTVQASCEIFDKVDLVVVSPLRRTLQTATICFPGLIDKCPWIALECIREAMGNYPCNKRNRLSLCSPNFSHISFNEILSDEDPLYDTFCGKRESISSIADRCNQFLDWVLKREENNVVVVSHSEFLYVLFNHVLDVEKKEQSHFKNAEVRSYILTKSISSNRFSASRIDSNCDFKVMHFIRHAQGEHNVAGEHDKANYLLPEFEDSILTSKGLLQCEQLKNKLVQSGTAAKAQLVVVSPLRRALQTATHSLPFLMPPVSTACAWVALEQVREVTGLHPCDRRFPISVQEEYFPHVNFREYIESEEDALYGLYSAREPPEDVQARCRQFLLWAMARPEKELVVVTHSAFLRELFGSVIRPVAVDSYFGFENAEIRSYVFPVSPTQGSPAISGDIVG